MFSRRYGKFQVEVFRVFFFFCNVISVHHCYCVSRVTCFFLFCNCIKCVGGGAFLKIISFYGEIQGKVEEGVFLVEGENDRMELLSCVCVCVWGSLPRVLTSSLLLNPRPNNAH